MTTIIFADEMRNLTGGAHNAEIAATSYRGVLAALKTRYPELSDTTFEKFSIAIDGAIVHRPLLETFSVDSELVFIPKIASG